MTRDAIHHRRTEILALAERHGASNLRIFGSVARGEATVNSDLDLLIHLAPERSLLDQGAFLMDLRELLGINVDVIEDGALSGRFGEIVRREAVPL